MSRNQPKSPINNLIWIVPIGIIGAIFYFSPNLPTGGLLTFFLLFILAFVAGADSQLKALRKMKDTPKSTIRGASQGAVELSGYIQPNLTSQAANEKTEKAYWKYTLKAQTNAKDKWKLVTSKSSHPNSGYMLMEDGGAQCWLDLNYAEYYTRQKQVQFKASEISQYLSSYPFLKDHESTLTGDTLLSIDEEWLSGDKKVFAVGNFVSSPSNKPPGHLKEEEEAAWIEIARKTEGVAADETLKGTTMVNTLIWNQSGNSATPLIISAFSENRLRRKIWFKFWLIIFSIIVLSTIPVLILIGIN